MNKIPLIVVISIIFVCSGFTVSIFGEEILPAELIDHSAEIGHQIEIVVGIAHWLTGIGTIVLAVALVRTFKHMEAVTKMTTIETNYRLRPWIGPTGSIKKMENSITDDCQFDIPIKNFGELAANEVIAKFVKSTKPVTRKSLQTETSNSFNLGPVMPTMEKHYWFFIDSKTWKKADSGEEPLHIGLYFEYEITGKKSGYGMLSEYNSQSKNFIHKEMWID